MSLGTSVATPEMEYSMVMGVPPPKETTPAADLPGLVELLALHLVGEHLAVLTAGGLLNGHDELAVSLNFLFATRAGESLPRCPERSLGHKASTLTDRATGLLCACAANINNGK
jgi:hypothetical protein